MVQEYTLIRSNRRTAAIHIKNGVVEVRAPLNLPKRDIDKFVASKESWITEKLKQSQAYALRRGEFTINYGDKITLTGKTYPLVAKTGTRAGFDGEVFYLPPNLPSDQIKQVVVQTYRRLAKQHIPSRVAYYAREMKTSPTAVKINGAKTHWGSCSGKRSLNFSWRLIMADDAVIDYVVVHELAHIYEMNHSARFWAIVENVLPDYKKRNERLKELQKQLATENWE